MIFDDFEIEMPDESSQWEEYIGVEWRIEGEIRQPTAQEDLILYWMFFEQNFQ